MSDVYTSKLERTTLGGYRRFSVGSVAYASPWIRHYALTPTINGSILYLPDARRVPAGSGVWTVRSLSGSNTLSIRTIAGSILGSLLSGNAVDIHLLDNSSQEGSWILAGFSGWTEFDAIAYQPTSALMFLGGSEDASNAREFNPLSDVWIERTDGTNDHQGGSGFSLTAQGYAAGHISSLKVDYYDPHAWTVATDVPGVTSRSNAAGVGLSGFGFLAGGFDGSTPQDRADQYIALSGTWLSRAAMPYTRGYVMCASPDALYAYLCGGSQAGAFTLSQRTMVSYGIGTNVYVTEPEMPYPGRSDGDAAGRDGVVWVFGGTDDVGPYDYATQYAPTSRTWSFADPAIPYGVVHGLGAVASVEGVVVAGGRTSPISAAKNDCAELFGTIRTWVTRTDIDVSTADWDQQCLSITR